MKTILFLLCLLMAASCSKVIQHSMFSTETAPAHFKARFETSKGIFEIEATRAWSPKAVDRLYSLIKNDYYDHIIIYRVVPNYVAQFAPTDTSLIKSWSLYKIPDEPVVKENTKGTIAFARGGVETRGSDIFINLQNNSPRLDTLNYNGVIGFPVIAEVTRGMDVVESFYSGYGDAVLSALDTLKSDPVLFLNQTFPKLDSIQKAFIINDNY